MNLSLTAMIVKNDERFEAVNEILSSALQTVNRSLDEKFQEIQAQLQSHSSTLQTVDRSLDEKFQAMQEQISSLINESVVAVLRELNQKFHTLSEALSSAKDESNKKLHVNATLDLKNENNTPIDSQDHCRNTSVVCDCSDIKTNGYRTNGVYRIYVVDQGQRYYANASCDMTTTNDGWTVFQRRKDGSVDFYREWNDYANGFGNPDGEFWMGNYTVLGLPLIKYKKLYQSMKSWQGNNFLHLLTSKRNYRLRIDLEDFERGKSYAEYSTFNISPSADKYILRIGNYSGTAGDSLSRQNGHRFSTKDNENDVHSSLNCAADRRGAWWYDDCTWSNLNGLYLRGRYSSNGSFNGLEGIVWHHWRGDWYSLKTTEMKISSP